MAENYVLLETIQLSQGAASVTFDNLPSSGYDDLKIVISARDDFASVSANLGMRINGSSTGLAAKLVFGSGTAAGGGTATDGIGLTVGSTGTSNTYSSTELYIPNYKQTDIHKTYSTESAAESNTTTVYMQMLAGLWSNNAAITSVNIYPINGITGFVAGSTFSLYGIATLGTTPVTAPFATGGNIVANDGTYWYHAFLSSGTFTPTKALSCDYLVVAGGGGGGGHNAGGGGAGGLRSTVTATGGGGSLEAPLSLTAQAYTVVVGGGGAGGPNFRGTNGVASSFTTITSVGGGGGGGGNGTGVAQTGGSGGGGVVGQNGGAGTANQGFAGGSAVSGGNAGAGGGGAGSLGGTTTNSNGGSGGNGVTISAFATPTNTGVSGVYAGGGGGSSFSGTQGAAGSGGASAGQYDTAVNATANTGSGAGARNREPAAAGNGGSGIVIVRYLMSS